MTKEAIIKGLKTVAGVDRDKMRLFADVIRDIIVEGLTNDGVVKIKGLGTFKVVEVKARKSVDVNTGAEIEISAHKKVTFTAENKLADEINEPLAHLEVVNLDENAEVVETVLKPVADEKVDEPNEVDEGKKDEAIKKLGEDAESLKGLLAMINGTINAAEENTKSEQPVEQPIEPELPIEQPAEPVEQPVELELPIEQPAEPVEQPIEPELPIEQPVEPVEQPIEPELPIGQPVEPVVRPVNQERTVGPVPIDLGPTSGENKNVFWRVAIIILAALLICCVCVWCFFKIGKRSNSDDSEKKEKVVVNVKPKSEEDRIAEIERIKAEAQKNEKEQIDTGYVYTGVRQPQKQEPMPVDDALAVIKVKEGDRLMTLSKQYYGHKMFWVYIYDANKDRLRSPNDLSVGMQLVIPKLDPKLIDIENEESVAAAIKLEREYLVK